MTPAAAPTDRLQVFVCTPLSSANGALITRREPRIDLVMEPDLLPPMRWAGDHHGDPTFRRTPEQQARFEALCDRAEALYGIPDTDPSQLARTVRANPRLRWVQTMAAGGGSQVRASGLNADEMAGVEFTTAAGAHAATLAEFALFGVLAGAKDLPRLQEQQRTARWSSRWAMKQVFEMTVLVVGMGHIGRETAARFAALGARVIGVNRSVREVPGVERVYPAAALATVVAEADAIINTLPQALDTDRMISRAVLANVRPGTIFVSTGRGSCVDEEALVEALQDGRIAFAALDVFAVEPLPADSPLWTLPNVVVSPHTAALNPAEDRYIAELFAANATRLLDGTDLVNSVDRINFY
ncbi:D-2-hydroxyacid dehydrogenase [Raineyella sp. LH-20]|uniref:D-2-hydroxyacid dehydrogenase n=1 Tax=Raineyella sp. LH-20 TaxID=3081204 RepID=UPI0029558C60|nr:D-2-hydroxyacid dehydrogenase [Raineyella sp. LH-20]WOP19275.1 D-2-hydroxyacid dehydrogenase [Raineyella sp. LH-20]